MRALVLFITIMGFVHLAKADDPVSTQIKSLEKSVGDLEHPKPGSVYKTSKYNSDKDFGTFQFLKIVDGISYWKDVKIHIV